MRHSWQWVWSQIVAGVVDAGYDDITPAHIGMFRHPTLDGQRPTELAAQLHVTKQSVNDLLGHLERYGYTTRQPDTSDGRGRVVRLTAKGRRLEELIRHHAEAADQRIAEVLGERRSAQLRQALEELSTKLTSESPSSKEAAR